MDIDIKEHIINNFKGDDITTLKNAIEEAIKEKDEIALPGMGVFLEIIWEESTDDEKNQLLEKIKRRIDR